MFWEKVVWQLIMKFVEQVELGSEIKFSLRDPVDMGRKWLADFNAWKTQLVSLKWIGVLIVYPLLKLPPQKMEPCFVLWS